MKDTEREIELIDYIEVVLKRKWLIAAATLAGLAGGWVLRADPPPTRYEASVLLMVKPKAAAASANTKGIDVAPSLSSQFYQSLALADDLKQALIDSLGLGGRISGLDGVLHVEDVDRTGMRLKVQSTDAGTAIEMVNAWAEIFLERNRGLSSDEVESFFDYVSNQYDRSRRLLESAEDSLQLFESSNQVTALDQQRSILDTSRSALQDTIIILQIQEQELKAELQNAEQQIGAVEIEGEALSFSSITALRDSSKWPESSQARSVIADMLKLDSYQKALHELDEEHELRLLEFDQMHGYEELEQQIAELQSLNKIYRSKLFTSPRRDLLVQREIKRLERKILQRSPKLDLGDGTSAPNPAYVEIAQTLDSLRATLKTGNELDSDSLQRTMQRGEMNIAQLKKEYYPLRRTREEFVERFKLDREDLTRHVESLSEAYELNVSARLSSRTKIATLRPALQSLQARIQGDKRALVQIQTVLRDIEKTLSLLVTRRDRLVRSRETYQGTFDRFSGLLEETRIAREKAAGDIQVLTRAIEARIVPQESPKQKAAISGAVALIISTFLVFLLEYVRKARLMRAASEP